ncbi:MAG: thioredoxin family protein [Kiritimatiellae bacterium]|nr:thioredoxin family protein [Kiritimatiellia bacterium]
MVLITHSGPETIPLGSSAPPFANLPATDGRSYGLDSFKEAGILVISFTCNHCPYAQAYEGRFIDLAREFTPRGVAFAAINPNDAETYPDDSFESMKKRAKEKGFPFPYLRDESQAVARAYGAVCTPHLFVFDKARKLVYEGRIDDNYKDPQAVKSPDLRNALEALLAGKPVPVPQTNPMGCSIKWR